MQITTIAVDLAKSVFEIAVSDRPGRVAERHRLARQVFLQFFAQRPPATVLMEACGSAHHWGRQIEALGHHVLLLPPHQTRPYVTGDKTDRSDTKGLLEAHRNEQIQPVPVKSPDQQALASLHRLRSAWLAARTARINTVRGLLREFGVVIPLGAERVVPMLQELLGEVDSGIPDSIRPTLDEVRAEILELERRMESVENQLRALARQLPVVHKLRTIPGVGLLTATALVAFVGDVGRFPSARHFASYLGLTPRERSSGLRRRLGAISKRGDAYIRMLLTHGARAVLWRAKSRQHPDRLRARALRLEQQRGHNKAAVALANKLARIVWAVWRRDVEFSEQAPEAA
jgi:transposase